MKKKRKTENKMDGCCGQRPGNGRTEKKDGG